MAIWWPRWRFTRLRVASAWPGELMDTRPQPAPPTVSVIIPHYHDLPCLRRGLEALAQADFVGGRMQVLVEDPARPRPAEAFEAVFAFDNRRYVEEMGFTVTANLFCPRAVFDAVGGFGVGMSEDLEWCR